MTSDLLTNQNIQITIIIIFVIVFSVLYFAWILNPYSSYSTEHYIGINVTNTNGVCTYTWLGGWDYESFVGDIRIGDIIIQHPDPYSVVFTADNCSLAVEMYMRPVNSWVRLYP